MNVDLTTLTAPAEGAAAASGCGPLVLAEDGIVDLIAVEIAASGSRPVALTDTERVLAAARILAAGGGLTDIAQRLHVSGSTARTLAQRAGDLGDPGDLWAA